MARPNQPTFRSCRAVVRHVRRAGPLRHSLWSDTFGRIGLPPGGHSPDTIRARLRRLIAEARSADTIRGIRARRNRTPPCSPIWPNGCPRTRRAAIVRFPNGDGTAAQGGLIPRASGSVNSLKDHAAMTGRIHTDAARGGHYSQTLAGMYRI